MMSARARMRLRSRSAPTAAPGRRHRSMRSSHRPRRRHRMRCRRSRGRARSHRVRRSSRIRVGRSYRARMPGSHGIRMRWSHRVRMRSTSRIRMRRSHRRVVCGRSRRPRRLRSPGFRRVRRSQRPRYRRIRRMAAVILHIVRLVDPRSLHVVLLDLARPAVLVVFGNALLAAWLVMNAARSTGKRNMTVAGHIAVLHNHAILIDMAAPSTASAHMHHYGVIGEEPATPHAARKSNAAVAEAVIHAAIVSNVRSPVSVMEEVMAAFKSPVARGPQRSGIRSRHPCAWNPVVAIRAVRPVTGRPHHPRLGANWLFIYRQHGRCKANTDKHPCEQQREEAPAETSAQFGQVAWEKYLLKIFCRWGFQLSAASLRYWEPTPPQEVAASALESSTSRPVPASPNTPKPTADRGLWRNKIQLQLRN